MADNNNKYNFWICFNVNTLILLFVLLSWSTNKKWFLRDDHALIWNIYHVLILLHNLNVHHAYVCNVGMLNGWVGSVRFKNRFKPVEPQFGTTWLNRSSTAVEPWFQVKYDWLIILKWFLFLLSYILVY